MLRGGRLYGRRNRALSKFDKLGVLSIARTAERAHAAYLKTVEILDQESSG